MKKRTIIIAGAVLLLMAMAGSDKNGTSMHISSPFGNSSMQTSQRTTSSSGSGSNVYSPYDVAYVHRRSKGAAGNPKYYLFDFDTNTLAIAYKSQYQTLYGTFTILEDGDIQISEGNRSITPYRFRRRDDRLYWVDRKTGEEDGTFYNQCTVAEAAKYL